ncbi:MAG: hypothetical protein ACT4O1_07615 [Gemmatimonadota bacterium]
MRRNLLLSFCLILGLSACRTYQPAQVGVDNNYLIDITNSMPHAMNVSLDLGDGISALGAIPAGVTRRFELRDHANNKVELIAVDQNGGMEKREEVQLSRSSVAKVRID